MGPAHLTAGIVLERNEFGGGSTSRKIKNVVNCGVRTTHVLSAGEWADSLTNVSVGDLLNDGPDVMDANSIETSFYRNSQCFEEVPFTCDSFDAAIAAHISSQNKTGFTGHSTNLSSIWDAEETCDEFSFQKQVANKKAQELAMTAASVPGEGISNNSSVGIRTNNQDTQQEAVDQDNDEDIIEECPPEPHETESSAKDLSSLTDMYWPDSLGPLELDVPACKYYTSEDLILSDSLSGLNHLIAHSLDAFQNSTFFGLNDKGMPLAAGAQGGASFAGKIGRGYNPVVPSVQV